MSKEVAIPADKPQSVRAVEKAIDRIWEFMAKPWPAIFCVGLVLLAAVTNDPAADPDLFHRVAVGRLVELTGGVMHQDPFSFSPRLESWVDHEWLSGVLFFQLARLGGDSALLVFDLTAMLLTILLAVWAHKQRLGNSGVILPWLLLTLAPLFVVWDSVVRCKVFTFLFLSLLFLVLERWRKGDRKWLWMVPPLFGIWTNLHGGVVAGFGLFGAFAAAASLKGLRQSLVLWACLAVSAAFTLINPYGPRLWMYLFEAATMDRPRIAEWTSIPLVSVLSFVLLLMVGVVVVGDLVSRRKASVEAWVLIGVSLTAAFWSQRIFTFLLLILAVFGGPSVRDLGGRLSCLLPVYWVAGKRVITVLLFCLFCFLGGKTAANLYEFSKSGLSREGFPVEAVAWLDEEGGGGKLLVHFNHGSFALWRLYPSYRVSVDGRYEEVYPQSTVDLSRQALHPGDPHHLGALNTLDPDYILQPVTGREDAFPEEWKVVFENGNSRILARYHSTPPEFRPPRGAWEPAF